MMVYVRAGNARIFSPVARPVYIEQEALDTAVEIAEREDAEVS